MTDSRVFVVRPLPSQLRSDLKQSLRVYVSLANIHLLGLAGEGSCTLKSSAGLAQAVLVSSTSEIKDSVIQTSKLLQDLHHMKLGDSITLSRSQKSIPQAKTITLIEVQPTGETAYAPMLSTEDCEKWAWLLEDYLERTELITPGVIFEKVIWRRQNRSFRIWKVDGAVKTCTYLFNQSCKVHIEIEDHSQDDLGETYDLRVSSDGVGALETQIEKLNRELASYNADKMSGMPAWFHRPRGIILHGPPGIGKTLLLARIAEAGWSKVFRLEAETFNTVRVEQNQASIRKTFEQACSCQPSLIVMDDLDTIVGKDDTHVRKTLRKLLEQLGNSRVLVIAATRVLSDIDMDLVNADRFSLAIELPVPDTRSRKLIIRKLMGTSDITASPLIDYIASKTHGYVGSDIKQLFLTAEREARSRTDCGRGEYKKQTPRDEFESSFGITEADYSAALRKVRPTAMRGMYVDTPNVHWNDIKGHDQVKKVLEHVLVWPYKYAKQMKSFDVEGSKGLLLYGPPGCSKTMIARAAATQSGHNFLAVKGAELLNMYVGESERAVRELFRKARSVSPSIIFFDEIDSIGIARAGAQQSNLNVVTTLLNELDGIEELKGVFVLAATNRPDVMDPALTRAGRLDTMIYVGPPDTEARQLIIQDRLQKVSCDEGVDTMLWARATEGYSGAEVAHICQLTKKAALEDYLKHSTTVGTVDRTTSQCKMEEQDPMGSCRISQQHFDQALGQVRKAITPDMIAYYEAFAARADG